MCFDGIRSYLYSHDIFVCCSFLLRHSRFPPHRSWISESCCAISWMTEQHSTMCTLVHKTAPLHCWLCTNVHKCVQNCAQSYSFSRIVYAQVCTNLGTYAQCLHKFAQVCTNMQQCAEVCTNVHRYVCICVSAESDVIFILVIYCFLAVFCFTRVGFPPTDPKSASPAVPSPQWLNGILLCAHLSTQYCPTCLNVNAHVCRNECTSAQHISPPAPVLVRHAGAHRGIHTCFGSEGEKRDQGTVWLIAWHNST